MDQGVIRSTKAKYRLSLIFKMLCAVDSGLDIPSVSMIDAMVMLNNAWNDVTPETIVNCFRKAGLSPYSQEQAVHDLDDPFQQDSEDLESCILRLRQEAPHLVPIGVDATSIVEAGDDLCTHREHLTDKQIIAEVTGDQHADDDTDQEEDEEDVEVTDEAIERPSAAAVNEALQILERLCLFSNDAAAMTKSIHDLTKAVMEHS